jgi:RimJ/RimL family protein N-acetyltransferase
MIEETVTLLDVYDDLNSISFLYELLRQRDIDTVSISHRVMPTVRDHIAFVMSKPYRAWYLIKWHGIKLGTIYLTFSDEIGIDILKSHHRQGIGEAAIKELMLRFLRPTYFANINPKNEASLALFRKCGFVDFQVTLRYNAADKKEPQHGPDVSGARGELQSEYGVGEAAQAKLSEGRRYTPA